MSSRFASVNQQIYIKQWINFKGKAQFIEEGPPNKILGVIIALIWQVDGSNTIFVSRICKRFPPFSREGFRCGLHVE